MASLLPLDGDLILFAWQIHDFFQSTGQRFPSKAPADCIPTVKSITSASQRPAEVRKSTERTTQRSGSVEPPPYPESWVIDKSALLQALKNFTILTAEYRSADPYQQFLQQQQATQQQKSINPTSDRPISPTSTSSSQTRHRRRDTSASEVIFSSAIGPDVQQQGPPSNGVPIDTSQRPQTPSPQRRPSTGNTPTGPRTMSSFSEAQRAELFDMIVEATRQGVSRGENSGSAATPNDASPYRHRTKTTKTFHRRMV